MWQTNNLALAVTLFTCGVPFFAVGDRKLVLFNLYTVELLSAMLDTRGRKLWDGMTIDEAANAAWKSGRKGNVQYCFDRTPALEGIVKAYNQQSADSKRAMEQPFGTDLGVPAGVISPTEQDVARIASQLFANRKWLADQWRKTVPFVAVSGRHKLGKETDGTTITTGSGKIYSLNLSDENRRKIKV